MIGAARCARSLRQASNERAYFAKYVRLPRQEDVVTSAREVDYAHIRDLTLDLVNPSVREHTASCDERVDGHAVSLVCRIPIIRT